MVNTKIEIQAQKLTDNLNVRLATAVYGMPVTKAYDASNDLYLQVKLGASNCAIIKFETQPLPASGMKDALGLTQKVFTPHVIKVGFDLGTRASGTAKAAAVVGAVRATGSVTLTGAVATKTVTINGSVFTAVAGAPANATEFTVAGDDAADAAALAYAINHSVDVLVQNLITAAVDPVTTNKVNLTAVVPGTAANAYGIVSNDASMVASGATMAGGIAGHTLVVNGVTFLALAVGQAAYTNGFLVGASNAACATNLAAAINASATAGVVNVVTAAVDPADATRIIITAVSPGVGGNSLAISQTGATLTLSGAVLAGGANGGIDTLTMVHILAETSRIGMALNVYAKGSIAVADLVQANIIGVYQDLYWGQLAQV